jgi:truncated hemoglobin YjbI
MRARHLKFRIGPGATCGSKRAVAALNDAIADHEARAEFGYRLAAIAEHMRNRDDDGA